MQDSNQEGKLNSMLRFVYRLGFLPSLAYNVALNKANMRPWYSRVDDKMLIGALPWLSIKEELIEKENVRAVVSLNESFELKLLKNWVTNPDDWQKSGVQFLQLETQDIFEVPTQSKLRSGVDFIMPIINNSDEDSSVYVHCKAGRTRSATLVACYLMKRNGWTPEQAVDYLASKRPQLAIHKPQWQAIRRYYSESVENYTDST